MARSFHFEFQTVSATHGIFENVGFFLPDAASVQKADEASGEEAPNPSNEPDEIGRINGHPRPLDLGKHTFTYLFSWWKLESAQIIDEKRPIKRRIAKLLWRLQDGNQYGMNEYHGWNYSPDVWVPGTQYSVLMLKETVTEKVNVCSFGKLEGDTVTIMHSFGGLFHLFRPDTRYNWRELFPEYPQVPNYFGRVDQGSDEDMDLAVKYVHDTLYWNLQHLAHWDCIPAQAERIIRFGVEQALAPYLFSHRRLKKRHGLDTKKFK